MKIYITYYTEQPEPSKKHAFEHTIGLKLLSTALKELYNIDLSADILDDHLSKGEHGKPYLTEYKDIHFNLTNSDGIVACAIDSKPVGIDIEEIHPFKDVILRRVLSDDEKEFYQKMVIDEESRQEWFCRIWTLKESFIKWSGIGLFRELNDFSFYFDTSVEPYHITSSEQGTYYLQSKINNSYFLSACSSTPINEFVIKEI